MVTEEEEEMEEIWTFINHIDFLRNSMVWLRKWITCNENRQTDQDRIRE